MSSATEINKEKIWEVYKRSSMHEGYVNILIYRPIAIFFALLFATLNLKPNFVTLLSFIASFLACLMFATGDYNVWLWALVPFHIGKILDCADGQLASLTNTKTKLGAFLDPFFDRIVDILTLSSLVLGVSRMAGIQVANDTKILVILLVAYLMALIINLLLMLNVEAKVSGVTRISNNKRMIPLWLARFLKWDGGFSGLLISLCIITVQIIPLLSISIALALFSIFKNSTQVYKQLN